jgi:hypothetical protein
MSKEVISEIDSHRVLEWINLITSIHNQMIEGDSFSAGFNLCFLQQYLVEMHKDLERQERMESMK